MTKIFRKLHNRRYWDKESWLGTDDVKGDAAKCLITEESSLSVYVLKDPDAQMERVVAALALTRDSLKNIDWAIVPETVLDLCEIQRDYVEGGTPDPDVNQWHCNLVKLTLAKIARLATAIRSQGKVGRCQHKDVGEAVQKSLRTNPIDSTQINSDLIESMKRRGVNVPTIP